MISDVSKKMTEYFTNEIFTKKKKRIQKLLEKARQGKEKALRKLDEILDILN